MALPINGATWQVMRLSRNRNWGHPNLVQFLERLRDKAPKTRLAGLLVGDMSQPRGGPMRTGHASHQVGLDADIWLTPMPDRELTREEREEMSATMVVAEDRTDVDPQVWTPAHLNVIKARAKDPQVARIFVNAAIKKALCRDAGSDRAGSTRCSRGGGTTITSTFGSSARRQSRMHAAAGTAGGRRLRQGARLLVHRRRSCTPSRRRRREAAARAAHGRLCRTPAAACCWRRSAGSTVLTVAARQRPYVTALAATRCGRRRK
jgi:hypothetical protein